MIIVLACLGVALVSLVVLVLMVLSVSKRIPPLVSALMTAQQRAEELKMATLGLPRRNQD